jgi:hypothetical protein
VYIIREMPGRTHLFESRRRLSTETKTPQATRPYINALEVKMGRPNIRPFRSWNGETAKYNAKIPRLIQKRYRFLMAYSPE